MCLLCVLILVLNLLTCEFVQRIHDLQHEIDEAKEEIQIIEGNKNHYKSEYEKNIKDTSWKKLKYIMLWSRGKHSTRLPTLSIANEPSGEILQNCLCE